MKKRISDIPKQDRPREKLQQKGAAALSDIELIAILLGSGTKGHDVMKVSAKILKTLDENSSHSSIEELQKINGVGLVKATLIAAAIIIAHNHPNGSLTPSKEDIEITRQLKSSGETLGIRLLDHIIFNLKRSL